MMEVTVTNPHAPGRAAEEMKMIKETQEIWVEAIGLAARQYVVQRLATDFPNYAPHFDVHLIPSPDSVVISVEPNDDIGMYLYHGTQPHVITGDNMPMGGDIFTDHVDHPGTRAIKPDIDQILYEAMAVAQAGALL